MTLARARFEKTIFNSNFYKFIDDIDKNPHQRHLYRTKDDDTRIVISYDPERTSACMRHPSYTEVRELIQNTVYNRLEDKAGKLRDAKFDGQLAVILCDGGCGFLTSSRDLATYHVSDVIFHFLEVHPEISFVLTLHVEQQLGHYAHSEVVMNLYRLKNSAERIGTGILDSLEKLQNAFPIPERSALNGLNLLRGTRPDRGDSFIGVWSMVDDEIKISARAVLELLAGEITQEDFQELHHFTDDDSPSPI